MPILIRRTDEPARRPAVEGRGPTLLVWYIDYRISTSLLPWQWIKFSARPSRFTGNLATLLGSPHLKLAEGCYMNTDLYTRLSRRALPDSEILNAGAVSGLFRELDRLPIANRDYGLSICSKVLRFYWLDTRCLSAGGEVRIAGPESELRGQIRLLVDNAVSRLAKAVVV